MRTSAPCSRARNTSAATCGRARASIGSRTSRRSDLPDGSAGTVLCIETFEHVFEVRRAFDEVFRILQPGGVFVITSPLNFRIHGYPDDYWRITPSCLRRMLEPYAARVSGYQGYQAFPHTVMGVGIKSPIAKDCAARASKLVSAYVAWARRGGVGPAGRREAASPGIPHLPVQGRAAPGRRLLCGVFPGRGRGRFPAGHGPRKPDPHGSLTCPESPGSPHGPRGC